MPRIQLIGSAYSGKSIIASGQETVNLYGEVNQADPEAVVPVTYYPTPGTDLYAQAVPPFINKARASYRTSIGTAYLIIGKNVYVVEANQTLSQIGSIADRPSQIYFADNGIVAVFVDGQNGYAIDLTTNALGIITDANFYPADYVVLLDTFFIFNRSKTNQFFITGSNVTYTQLTTTGAFDPLDIAAKSGFNDPIVGIAAIHRELWLIGALTTEIWIGTGAADFYFQEVQGTYINHGCSAQYSIATQDVLVFFLQQDLQGNCLVLQGQGYDVSEISTPRIVSEFRKYQTISDAIGFCFQLEDHSYYALIFPTANKGWLYDLTTSSKLGFPFWSEWNYIDNNGNFNRPRANCCMFFNGFNLVGDWENGNLLKLDINTNTDFTNNGTFPIVRVKTFPHMVENNNRISYKQFEADMEVGTAKEGAPTPQISLSWSDDKGKSYGNPILQSMGNIGEYLTVPMWNRLGQARDRVFKLSWSDDVITALNGAFINTMPSKS